MANIAKTIVATGGTSGLGFEAMKQLLAEAQPYRLILGARDTIKAESDFSGLSYDKQKHQLTVLPLQLNDLRTVKTFAKQTLDTLGPSKKIDLLFLNAGMVRESNQPGINGSKWCEPQLVNTLSQHYLVHLLRERLAGRIVYVSSGAIRGVSDPSTLEATLTANAGADPFEVYSASKFTQLLTAHWWRRQLTGQCEVVAVSPGMIPGTGLAREVEKKPEFSEEIMKDARSIPEGAKSMVAAVHRDDLPSDPDQIFLTSWGEWWSTDVYKPSLDKALQDKWSPSLEQIEKDEKTD